MKKLGIPQLKIRQIEELCTIVEETARKFIFSEVPPQESGRAKHKRGDRGFKAFNLNS